MNPADCTVPTVGHQKIVRPNGRQAARFIKARIGSNAISVSRLPALACDEGNRT